MRQVLIATLVACLFHTALVAIAFGERPLPHNQSEPPGPALSPEEAIKKMTVPPGFEVELVASEPMIVNPTAMTFDARGRIWVLESIEYPRADAGPGRDRLKILEDTDGDGRADKETIFADGLNIPSGVAIGAGGVWVVNAPDLLFMQDTDGDDRADKIEVVLTGFGRTDTHELPNSLTWGPDGWLYGTNGCFNLCHVKHKGKSYGFAGAIFRFHPRTHDFELVAEGLSNPWGIAFDPEGSMFVSACVIDHLWHIVESGAYISQTGNYRPFAWAIESIVKHKHQKAAYCGLTYYDSDAYPQKYRGKLYMGNIHGNCVNCDWLERDGSTYFAKPDPDFLSANDAWFMPVSQKTGPDGCMYVLDWYDQFHCYQDAMREPENLDRLKGRLYRIRYTAAHRTRPVNLEAETDDQLIERLSSGNGYHRETAQRLLWERANPETRKKLQRLVLNTDAPRRTRMHALWAVISMGSLDEDFHLALLEHEDPAYRAWGVRAAGNDRSATQAVEQQLLRLANDPSPDVRLQLAIAAPKSLGPHAVKLLTQIIAGAGDDKLIPKIVWANLNPLLEDRAEEFLAVAGQHDLNGNPRLAELMPRAIDRILGRRADDVAPILSLISLLSEGNNANPAALNQCFALLARKVQTGELAGQRRAQLRDALAPALAEIIGAADDDRRLGALQLAASWNDPAGVKAAREVFASDASDDVRLRAFEALVAAGDPALIAEVSEQLTDAKRNSVDARRGMFAALGRLQDPQIGEIVLSIYDKLEPQLKPQAIELLTGRVEWSKQLLTAVQEKRIAADEVNLNHVRKLHASRDEGVRETTLSIWGAVRPKRNLNRDLVIYQLRDFLLEGSGDPHKGQVVFNKVCGQCHKIYGEGQDVGPDITLNGRSSFDQLMSNVFDPSLIIGADYRARTVITTDGRVITGLLAEESSDRVVLKMQGGKTETIARDDIDEMETSEVSLMPEGLEKQLSPEELRDLFAFLMLDKPPSDPTARRLPITTPKP